MVVCDAYKPVLQEYQEALEENFENMSEYTYVQSTFDPYFTFYRGEDIYYAEYDFCDDGLPELLIAVRYEATEQQAEKYQIKAVYGTDGTDVDRLDASQEKSFSDYSFCDGNIMRCHWTSGGLSAGGDLFFQLNPGMTEGTLLDEMFYMGMGDCYRGSEPDESNEISRSEYDDIVASYKELENLSIQWELLSDSDFTPSSESGDDVDRIRYDKNDMNYVYDGEWINTGFGCEAYLPVYWNRTQETEETISCGIDRQYYCEDASITIYAGYQSYEPTEEGIYEYLLENGYQPYYADANGVTGVAFEAQNGTEISFAFPAVDDEIVQFSVYSPNEEIARAYARDLFSSISLR